MKSRDVILTGIPRSGTTLVAEGIETPDQFAHLARLGVELGQGYFFDPALSAEAFEQNWLRAAAI